MEFIWKKYKNSEKCYYLYSIGKWHILIHDRRPSDIEFGYNCSESEMLKKLPLDAIFKTKHKVSITAENTNEISYASFKKDDFDEIILLGIADITIVMNQAETTVYISKHRFEDSYNKYPDKHPLIEESSTVYLPDDDITELTMLIDDFEKSISMERAFSPMDFEHLDNLSSTREGICEGDVDDLIKNCTEFIEFAKGDSTAVDNIPKAEKIIFELNKHKKSYII